MGNFVETSSGKLDEALSCVQDRDKMLQNELAWEQAVWIFKLYHVSLVKRKKDHWWEWRIFSSLEIPEVTRTSNHTIPFLSQTTSPCNRIICVSASFYNGFFWTLLKGTVTLHQKLTWGKWQRFFMLYSGFHSCCCVYQILEILWPHPSGELHPP